MRKLLPILALLCWLPAQAAVTYHNSGNWGGTSPTTSGSLTPNASGDQLIALTWNYNNGSSSVTNSYSGTGTGTWNLVSPPGNSGDSNNSIISAGVNLVSSGVAQTITTSTSPSSLGNVNNFWLDYSGGMSVKNGSFKVVANPGTGTGAIAGTAVTVASGDKMIVFVVDGNANGVTMTSPAGTQRSTAYGGIAYVFEFAGSGGSITPTFTVTTHGTDNYDVYQLVLSASSGASCTHNGYTNGGVLATPNGTTGNYVGKSGLFVTPDCSTINYWQPSVGGFGAT